MSRLEVDVTLEPCQSWCTTRAFGDDVCMGCKRTAEEVDTWLYKTDEEKRAVTSRIFKEYPELAKKLLG